jgi:hypothetical protein
MNWVVAKLRFGNGGGDGPTVPDTEYGVTVLSLPEMLPDIHALSRIEKLRLIQVLARELAEEEAGPPIPPDRSYPVWPPERAFTAAETMLQLLRQGP